MSKYFIAQLKIHNQQLYLEYLKELKSYFDNYSGRYLVSSDNPVILEGNWNYNRLVLLEFPNQEELDRWYYSPEYQSTIKLRHDSSEADVIVVDGL